MKAKPIVKCLGCGGNHFLKQCLDKDYKEIKMHEISKSMTKLEGGTTKRVPELANLQVEMKGPIY